MTTSAYTDPLVSAYCLATQPGRRRALAEYAAAKTSPVMALFYHRVADDHPNDWTISTARFKEQINWVRDRFEIVSLPEAQRRLGAAGNSAPAVCITFDDGYADNCREALPWLIAERVPFTYFVATSHVLENRPFEHDVRRGRPLAPNAPDEICELAAAGVEIGAHTRTHPDVAQLDEDRLDDEIVGSKRDVEALTGRAVRYFAFPFGLRANMSVAAFRTAFCAGFWGVCSAYGGYNLPGDDTFHIQRFHGDPGWGRFRNWLTFDVRKQRRTERFNPGEYRLTF